MERRRRRERARRKEIAGGEADPALGEAVHGLDEDVDRVAAILAGVGVDGRPAVDPRIDRQRREVDAAPIVDAARDHVRAAAVIGDGVVRGELAAAGVDRVTHACELETGCSTRSGSSSARV
jgi:hypothetical protein